MDSSNHGNQATAMLPQSETDRRKAQAFQDLYHLEDLLFDARRTKSIYALLSIKAEMFLKDESPEQVACVVCEGFATKEWKLIGEDPEKAGFHCAAHKAEFHSVCELTLNCCDGPYDPDRDYEWRDPIMPQE